MAEEEEEEEEQQGGRGKELETSIIPGERRQGESLKPSSLVRDVSGPAVLLVALLALLAVGRSDGECVPLVVVVVVLTVRRLVLR